eukprot:jgi/Botrbrau1/22023/Bobra.0024s0037.1
MQGVAARCWRTVLRVGSVGDCQRWASTSSEQRLVDTIKSSLSSPTSVKVIDTSGGCGTMFTIEVIAADFKGMSIVRQHQVVTNALKDEIPKWHGFTLNTKSPN